MTGRLVQFMYQSEVQLEERSVYDLLTRTAVRLYKSFTQRVLPILGDGVFLAVRAAQH